MENHGDVFASVFAKIRIGSAIGSHIIYIYIWSSSYSQDLQFVGSHDDQPCTVGENKGDDRCGETLAVPPEETDQLRPDMIRSRHPSRGRADSEDPLVRLCRAC